MSSSSSGLSTDAPQSRSKRNLLQAATLSPFFGATPVSGQSNSEVAVEGFEIALTFNRILRGETRIGTQFVQTLGFNHPGDGGGGLYSRNSTQIFCDSFISEAGDWWSVIACNSVINVRQFGAVGDGQHDDTNAVKMAVRAFRRARASVLYFPAGSYRVSQPILHYSGPDDLGNIRIVGDGTEVTRFVLDGPIESFLFAVTGDVSSYGSRHVRFVDFENFGILGNGQDRQNLFSFTCADRINLRNIHAYNFVGTGIRGRQWWDSLCDVRFVRGGDATPGSETALVDLDFVFADELSDSACNNIVFPETTQLEAYRWQAMRWGRSTRRCRFLGKVHGWIGRSYQVPAVHLQGATSNLFFGASIAHSMRSDTFQRDLVIENTDYIPSHNRIMACDFVNGVEFIGDVRANIVTDCVFRNKDHPAVIIDRGRDNVVRNNVANPKLPLLEVADPRARAAILR